MILYNIIINHHNLFSPFISEVANPVWCNKIYYIKQTIITSIIEVTIELSVSTIIASCDYEITQ